MVKWITSWCLFVVVASLLLLGCKTSTAADVEAPIPFEDLDTGREPRTLLRYSIADGTTTTSITTFVVSKENRGETTVAMSDLKSLEVESVFGPARNSDDGLVYDYEITSAKAVVAPGASPEARAEIRRSAASLKGAGATASFNDRGRMLNSSMNERAMEVPVRALLAIINTEHALSLIVLPHEEVGVGARWIVRNELRVHGFRMSQDLTYTLVERPDQDHVVLDVTFERYGQPQVVELPDGETSVEVIASHTSGAGRIELDLRSLRSSARAKGQVTDVVVMVHDGERKRREINESLEIRIDSRSRVLRVPEQQ
jgi:hypothetical protein